VLPGLQVPKMLAALRQTWAPRSFVVSFKLETDESIVLQKVHCAAAPLEISLCSVGNKADTRL
jgi:phosphopantothenate-cysteine ligase